MTVIVNYKNAKQGMKVKLHNLTSPDELHLEGQTGYISSFTAFPDIFNIQFDNPELPEYGDYYPMDAENLIIYNDYHHKYRPRRSHRVYKRPLR